MPAKSIVLFSLATLMLSSAFAQDFPLQVVGNQLTWNADADLQSGLAYFVIERDGKFLAKLPESDEHTLGRPLFQSLYNGDTPRQPLPEMRFTDTPAQDGVPHSYRVIAVNTVGLRSKKKVEP